MAQVYILLATYNGSKYIREMIDSVLAQDFQDFHLVLSDDMSKDGTENILAEYAQKYPDRITHYRSGRRFGNAQGHFMHLLQQFHDAPYIMFCDQDDFWHPDKVSKTLRKMKEIEKTAVPAMVHTDLRVVDGSLQKMDDSFMHFSSLKGDRLQLKQLLVQNVVTGCTMMVNKALADLACSHIPEGEILMHDWWLALIAAAMGTTGYLDEATIDYRQHGNNVVGAKDSKSLGYLLGKIRNDGVRRAMQMTYRQAKSFEQSFRSVMKAADSELVRQYGALVEQGFWARRVTYVKYGFYKFGIHRILSQLIWG